MLICSLPFLCMGIFGQAQSFDVSKLPPGVMPPTGLKSPSDSAKNAGPKKPSVADKTKGNKKHEGLFTLYQDTATGSVQMYIRKDQLDKEFIYQSFSLNGPTSLFLNQSMHRTNFAFKMQKVWDKIEFHVVNTDFYYDPKNEISKTANVDKSEAVFYVDKFSIEDSTGFLVSADGMFLSEKMDAIKPASFPGFSSPFQFGLGGLNPTKTKYNQIRSFSSNTDVIVDMAYDNPNAIAGFPDVVDPRYVRVRMQHSFIEMPKNNFRPRIDDHRIGYFTQQVTDQTSIKPTPYRDMINRWNLVKKDPTAALSEPTEPIVFYVENTTPKEYRQIIVDAGLKWNEAFEKAGFKNAVQMRIMADDATWDPSDLKYNVIRWVASASPSYGAIGPSFVNPRTGQILGADITVEWFSGNASKNIEELMETSTPKQINSYWNTNEIENKIINHKKHHAHCNLGTELFVQYQAALTMVDAADGSEADVKELHKQYLTYLVLHEMGHTLGLNHNMKASQMLSPAEVNDKNITRKIGSMASVMDYPAINFSLDKSKQGDYYTTKAGPYDIWAIEFGYTPFSEAEEAAGLAKILSKSNDPKLIFGNDGDDMRSPGKAIDPRVNINDFTNDAIAYAEDRYKLVNSIMPKLVAKYSKNGQSYAELRARYGTLNGQRNSMTSAVSRYIGGVYIDRSQPEQKSGNKPMTPVPLAVQKKAMEVLSKYVFAPNAFDADAQVFPYLQRQRRGFDQGQEDYKITSNVLQQQVFGALAHILHPNTLQRITNSRLYGNEYNVVDVMSDLTKACFDADINGNVNYYRQYLQTTFANGAASLLDEKSPIDDVSKAAARYTLKKLRAKIAAAQLGNEETKAHRANLLFIIDNALTVK